VLRKGHIIVIFVIGIVLFIPSSVYAQIIDFTTDEERYHAFGIITLSGVVTVDPDISEIFIEIFSPEGKLTGFARNINPDGTFIMPYHTNPDVFTIDGEYTFKITYVNSVEKTINYQKWRDIAPFVDQSKNPCYYVDRYENEPLYEEWFDDNFPEYISIFEAVGLQNKRDVCEPEMSEAEKQAREEIPNPCINIREPKVATEYQGDIGLNDPAYMEAFREAQSQYFQQMQLCLGEYQKVIDQRVGELTCGDFEFGEYTPIEDYDLVYDLFLLGLNERNLDTSEVLVKYKGNIQFLQRIPTTWKRNRKME